MILTRAGKRWEFRSTYAERHVLKAAGCRWDPQLKRWYSERETVALKFIEVADDDARAELAGRAAEHERSLEDSRAQDADINIPAPKGFEYMPFQKAGVAYALKRRGTLIGDEMGLGKTIEALGIINADPKIKSVLVICPATLKRNWQIEAFKVLVQANQFNPHVVDSQNLGIKTRFTIVNWDILWKFMPHAIEHGPFDLVIADEAHFCKNAKAQRSKALMQLLEGAGRRVLLTGTPIVNRPMDLYNLIKATDPHLFPNFMEYAKRYCAAKRNRFGWDFSGASYLEELHGLLRANIMVRRLKADVLTELPAKTRTVVEIDADSRDLRAAVAAEGSVDMDRLHALTGAWSEQVETLSEDKGFKDIAEASVKRHQTALAKVDAVVKFVTELLESEDKVIVFAHHHDVVAGLREGLAEFNPVEVTGNTSISDRQLAVEDFQNRPECRVFIGNIQSAGVGLTLTAARTVVFAELDWVPGHVSQAEDRAHRIGQKDNVNVYHLVVDGSIDSWLARTIMKKQAVIKAVTDEGGALPAKIKGIRKSEPPAPKAKLNGLDRRHLMDKLDLTEEKMEEALVGVKLLASACDHAQALDGAGFNKVDAAFGHKLAECSALSPRQADAARHLCWKYKRQLPRYIVEGLEVGQ